MKNQKGFIQIPILIAIIVGIIAVGGGGHFGYTKFKKYEVQQAERERQAQELIDEQQKALEEAQKTIEESKKLTGEMKSESQEKNEEISGLQKELDAEKNKQTDLTIRASEIEPYLNGIVEVSCKNSEGSGSLWNLDGQYSVLTNYHVVKTPYSDGSCRVEFRDIDAEYGVSGKGGGFYQIYPSTAKSWNIFTDIASMSLNEQEVCDANGLNCFKSKPIENLNYGLSFLNKCSSKVPTNVPVVILGYPVFGRTKSSFLDFEISQNNLIVSNGVVSGYDDSSKQPLGNLPYSNYFVSAKIDSGNSGGIALSKDKNGLCILGIPTWLVLGNYETQGLIQNIHNVLYSE